MKKLVQMMCLVLVMNLVHAQQIDMDEVRNGAMQEAEAALGAIKPGSAESAKALLGIKPAKKNINRTPAQKAEERKERIDNAQRIMVDAMFKEPKPGFWQMTGLLPGELAFVKEHEMGMKKERRIGVRKEPNAVLGAVEHTQEELGKAEKEYVAGVNDIERKVGATEAAVFGIKPKREERPANLPMLTHMVQSIAQRPISGKPTTMNRNDKVITTNDEQVPGVSWKRASKANGVLPTAIRAGFHQSVFAHKENLLSSFICRAQINGSWQVGSLLDNGLCLIQHQGQAYSYEQYQVLEGAARELAWQPMIEKSQNNVVIGDTKNTQGICHVVLDQTIPHGPLQEHARDVIVGHIEDNKCVYGFNGKEQSSSSYEVLTKK